MQAIMIYTSKCNNLNILRYDVLFISRLINMMFYSVHNTALSWTRVVIFYLFFGTI
jgi:hypothetical protein